MSAKNYLATYAKSFNWAGFFLPKDTYKKCSALYDFCRVADNIADDENTITVKKEEREWEIDGSSVHLKSASIKIEYNDC